MNLFLLSLSENDKRLIFAILIILILVIVLIGYIGFLITKIMKWQGKKMDTLVADALVTRVITDKHHFIRYARKKNWRLFFKQAYIGIILMILAAVVLIIRDAVYKDFSYNPFNKDDGFGTLLFIWDFSVCFRREGLSIILNWPALVNSPHFVLEAWGGYVFVVLAFIGGIWYFIALQSLIARTLRMYKLFTTAFEKSLDGFNQNSAYVQAQQNPQPVNPDPNNNNQQ